MKILLVYNPPSPQQKKYNKKVFEIYEPMDLFLGLHGIWIVSEILILWKLSTYNFESNGSLK